MAHEPAAARLKLPLLVVGPSDVLRLKRELESLDDYLHQASLRHGGPAPKLPRTSRLLDDLASSNELNLLQAADRQRAIAYLKEVADSAPVVTMSFGADPSSAFVSKLIAWLRQNIDPGLLLTIGLQPTIGAGCTLRTANHYYDFSLRQHFTAQRQLLIDKLHAAAPEPPHE